MSAPIGFISIGECIRSVIVKVDERTIVGRPKILQSITGEKRIWYLGLVEELSWSWKIGQVAKVYSAR